VYWINVLGYGNNTVPLVNGEDLLRQIIIYTYVTGARGGAMFEALRYKPEGRGIDSRWCHWNFSLT
jgi:hypothetical protein